MKNYTQINPTRSALSRVCCLLVACLLLPTIQSRLISQEAQNQNTDETIVLDPFDVTSVDTRRYVAPNTISGTAMNTLLRDVPMTINVITSDFIEDAVVAGSIERALDYNSSITQTTRAEVNSRNAIFSIRGFRNRNLLLDGVLANDFIPTYLIDRIEVVKGPNTLYGQSDPGGLVNVISKRPKKVDSLSTTFRYGSWNTWQVDFDWNIAEITKGLNVRFLGQHKETDGWRWLDDKTWSFGAVAADWDVAPKTRLRLLFGGNSVGGQPSNRATYPFMRVPTDLNGDGVIDNTVVRGVQESSARYNNDFVPWEWTSETRNNFFDQTASYLQLSALQGIGENVNLSYNFIRSDQHNEVYFREFNTFSPAGTIDANHSGTNHFNTTDAHTLNALMRIDTGGISQNLMAGLRYTKDSNRGDQYRLRVANAAERAYMDQMKANGRNIRYTISKEEILAGEPIWLDDVPTWEEVRAAGFRANNSDKSFETVTTAYVSDSVTLMDGRLRVLGGLRNIEIKSWAIDINGNGGDKRKSTDTSYQIGVNYALSDHLIMFANNATAFNPNGFNRDTGDFFPPESSDAYEVGLKIDGLLGGKVSGSVALFRIDKQNVVRNDFNPVTFSSDTEITDDRSEGFDIELFFDATDSWQTMIAFSHLNARTVKTATEALGLRLEGATPNKLTLWTSYEVRNGPLKGLRFGGGGIWADGPIQQFGTSSNRLVVEDGYTEISAFLRYTTEVFGQNTVFGLNVNNLTNEFFMRARANTSSPRNIVGSVRVDF